MIYNGSYTHVVFICRFNNMENIPLWTCKVWSLLAGGLYIQVVFTAGLTVYELMKMEEGRNKGSKEQVNE